MKALVGAFNQEKALVGAFSVIVQPIVEPMDRFTALGRSELHSSHTLMDDTGSAAYWWMAVGASRLYEDGHKDGRIPGPWLWNGYNGGYKRVELYVNCNQ